MLILILIPISFPSFTSPSSSHKTQWSGLRADGATRFLAPGRRGWPLFGTLLNFRPYAPRSNQPRTHDSPAHRLNGKRYHEHWLHNLMASTSLMGFRNREPAIR
jgi:hypothetical protein